MIEYADQLILEIMVPWVKALLKEERNLPVESVEFQIG